MNARGMPSALLQPRLRILLAVLALSVSTLIILPGFQHWESQRLAAAIAARSEFTRVSRLASEIADSTSNSRSRSNPQANAFPGRTPAFAASSLVGHLQRLGRESGFDVREVRIDADSVFVSGVGLIRIRIVGLGDATSVAQWLASVESGRPIVRTTELVVIPDAPRPPDTTPRSWRVSAAFAALGYASSSPLEVP